MCSSFLSLVLFICVLFLLFLSSQISIIINITQRLIRRITIRIRILLLLDDLDMVPTVGNDYTIRILWYVWRMINWILRLIRIRIRIISTRLL